MLLSAAWLRHNLVAFSDAPSIHAFDGTALAFRKLISALDLTLGGRSRQRNAPTNEPLSEGPSNRHGELNLLTCRPKNHFRDRLSGRCADFLRLEYHRAPIYSYSTRAVSSPSAAWISTCVMAHFAIPTFISPLADRHATRQNMGKRCFAHVSDILPMVRKCRNGLYLADCDL
jgi:hypothetical protein